MKKKKFCYYHLMIVILILISKKKSGYQNTIIFSNNFFIYFFFNCNRTLRSKQILSELVRSIEKTSDPAELEESKKIDTKSLEILHNKKAQYKNVQTTQPIELISPTQLFLPLSVVNSYISKAMITYDPNQTPPKNDYDAHVLALSEGRYGENDKEAAEKIKELFVDQVKTLISSAEAEQRKEDIDFALKDASYIEEEVTEIFPLPE